MSVVNVMCVLSMCVCVLSMCVCVFNMCCQRVCVLSTDLHKVKSYIDAFRYGAYPHAGGGIGEVKGQH